LTDGQLADGLAYHVETRGDGEPTEFGKLLSDELTAALRDYRQRSERDRLVWEEHRNAALRERDPDTDSLNDEVWAGLRERERVLTRVRQDVFQLAPELREELIVLADGFRYDYEGYDEDEDELRLSLTLQRADGDPPFKTAEPWDGRNYDLFAMLANVRNGRGFAGVPTGEGFVPIALPRGIPEDASPEAAAFLDSFGPDGHSQTFLTLAELDDYDWDGQSTMIFGVVAADTYERLKAAGEAPRTYSGGITGHGIVTFTEEAYAAWVKAGKPPLKEPNRLWVDGDDGFDLPTLSDAMRRATPEGVQPGSLIVADDALQPQAKTEPVVEVKPYVRMRWRESYREAAGESWFRTLEQLRQQVPDGGTTDDVRIVAFFDN
jgi:hypothetical protein